MASLSAHDSAVNKATEKKIIKVYRKFRPDLQWVVSFDVGIKNLAYCLLSYDDQKEVGNQIQIRSWDVIDLMDEKHSDNICSGTVKSGKSQGKVCGKKAGWFDKNTGSCYCKTHKTASSEEIKKKKATSTDTMVLCSNMVKELDKRRELLETADIILIENQPTKNPKMKNLSNMLYSYFIIRGVVDRQLIKKIQFIDPRNKLDVYDGPYVSCNLKGRYARNKFYGKVYCRYLIRAQADKLAFFDSFKKKDDLADSMMQGAWFLMKKNLPKKGRKIKKNINNECQSNDEGKALIEYENNWYRYKQIRARRPKNDKMMKLTLANVKYIISKNPKNWKATKQLSEAIPFFFGTTSFLEGMMKK